MGILHYRLVLGKSEQKGNGYLKHNKNVESEHYQKEVKKTDRDKSCDVNRSHNISAKCLPTKILPKGVTKDVSGVSNETMLAKKSRDTESIELFSTYFKRKEQPKKQKTSIHTESNESDRRSEQTSKILMLEKELKGRYPFSSRAGSTEGRGDLCPKVHQVTPGRVRKGRR